ncbi:hypothetical protein TNCV_2522181 [Trichonephila clavipes]|nr:hypothetical protein TNCV_2522181 [Trichonephila clavipes]
MIGLNYAVSKHPYAKSFSERGTGVLFDSYVSFRYTTTNRRAPLAVRPLEALAPGQDYGTPTRTGVTLLPQQLITELPFANTGKKQRPLDISLTQHATNSYYPIGQAVRPPEDLIGRGSCK